MGNTATQIWLHEVPFYVLLMLSAVIKILQIFLKLYADNVSKLINILLLIQLTSCLTTAQLYK